VGVGVCAGEAVGMIACAVGARVIESFAAAARPLHDELSLPNKKVGMGLGCSYDRADVLSQPKCSLSQGLNYDDDYNHPLLSVSWKRFPGAQ